MTKLCTDCRHFMWIKDWYKDRGMPEVYEQGYPSCNHPEGWKEVEVETLGFPLRPDWARSGKCGDEGTLFEPIATDKS